MQRAGPTRQPCPPDARGQARIPVERACGAPGGVGGLCPAICQGRIIVVLVARCREGRRQRCQEGAGGNSQVVVCRLRPTA
jgi:hypothetical protein